METEETQRAIAYVQDMANKTKFERLKRLMVADLELEDTVRRLCCDCRALDSTLTAVRGVLAGDAVVRLGVG